MDVVKIIEAVTNDGPIRVFMLGFFVGTAVGWFFSRTYYKIHIHYRIREIDRLQSEVAKLAERSERNFEIFYKYVEDLQGRRKEQHLDLIGNEDT